MKPSDSSRLYKNNTSVAVKPVYTAVLSNKLEILTTLKWDSVILKNLKVTNTSSHNSNNYIYQNGCI